MWSEAENDAKLESSRCEDSEGRPFLEPRTHQPRGGDFPLHSRFIQGLFFLVSPQALGLCGNLRQLCHEPLDTQVLHQVRLETLNFFKDMFPGKRRSWDKTLKEINNKKTSCTKFMPSQRVSVRVFLNLNLNVR